MRTIYKVNEVQTLWMKSAILRSAHSKHACELRCPIRRGPTQDKTNQKRKLTLLIWQVTAHLLHVPPSWKKEFCWLFTVEPESKKGSYKNTL